MEWVNNPFVVGIIASLVAQLTKAGGWNRWADVLYGLGIAGGGGYFFVNQDIQSTGFILTLTMALAFHSLLLNGTALGTAVKWNLLGKFGDVMRAVFPSNDKPPGTPA